MENLKTDDIPRNAIWLDALVFLLLTKMTEGTSFDINLKYK